MTTENAAKIKFMECRMIGNIQHVAITQDTAHEIAQGIIDTEKEAANWYDEFLRSEEEV